MSVATRLTGFAALLGLTLGGAALAGAAIDPTDEPPTGQHGGEGAEHGEVATRQPLSGLAVTQDGYAIEADSVFFDPGQASTFTFRITDPQGRVVRDAYQLEHEKELHLIVVRRDTAIFTHVHPTRGSDGTWSVDLALREPGVYRAYADFTIAGTKRALAADVFVPGDFRPVGLPAPASVARAVDDAGQPVGGLDAAFHAPGARAGRESSLTFTVDQAGRPSPGLEPYLGAEGHLVALREGDLAYLHVHPVEHGPGHEKAPARAHGQGEKIEFTATFPTPGRYRLFLQFKTGGEIRTASYTLEVPR